MHDVREFLRVAAANGWQVTRQDHRGALLPRVFALLRANWLRPQQRRLWVPPGSEDDAPKEWVDGPKQ